MFQKISILNKCCSFLTFYSKNPEKISFYKDMKQHNCFQH